MNDTPLQPGDTVGRYKVMERLGTGRWGALYKARSLQHGTWHVLRLPTDPSLTTREALRRELRLQQGLTHPNVVPLAEIIEEGGTFALVSAFVEGTSLREVLMDAAGMDLTEVMPLFVEVVDAIQTAHTLGLVHEGLTPGDILLAVTPAGVTARVADFGLWRALPGGVAPGHAGYRAPELFLQGAHVDARSDVFSLGCILYEMLVGHPPFIDRPGTGEDGGPAYDPIAALVPDCPLEVAAVVERALELNPEHRFPDVGSFARALLGEDDPEPPARETISVDPRGPEAPPPSALRAPPPQRGGGTAQAPQSGGGPAPPTPTGAEPAAAPRPQSGAGSTPTTPHPRPPSAALATDGPASPATPHGAAPVPLSDDTKITGLSADDGPGPDPAWQGVSWALRFVIVPISLIGGLVVAGAWVDGGTLRAARAEAAQADASVKADLAEEIAAAARLIEWGAPAAPIQAAAADASRANTFAARVDAEDKLSEVLLRQLKLLTPAEQADVLAHRELERMLITDRDHLDDYRAVVAEGEVAESRPFTWFADGLGFAGKPPSPE